MQSLFLCNGTDTSLPVVNILASTLDFAFAFAFACESIFEAKAAAGSGKRLATPIRFFTGVGAGVDVNIT